MAVCLPDLLNFVTLDVFTETRFSGNPLAVILDADGLSDQAMLTIAREFNLSETIFVQKPQDPVHDARVRIFFPTGEIPFAGHPTVGCAIHLASQAQPQGDFERMIFLEEEAGLVPVTVSRCQGRVRAEFTAPIVPMQATAGSVPDVLSISKALGLGAERVGFSSHTPGLWEGGPRFLYVPVKDTTALAQARPFEPAWSNIMDMGAVDSAYVYTQTSEQLICARMFSPTAGIPEDPATGSAAAILARQLLAAGALDDGETCFEITQGAEMGRPSQISLRIDVTQNALVQVRVSGSAVSVSHGQIRRPTN
ncbi:PhzF family phenazine biosynthesis protein [Sulfitobacter sp. 1151]|uniref:PhzF family phenazine biosynthesis protein n=2 Tax=Parasulfitobacter algicola TaxID=2614809 RepID=A0ABX2IWP6_9RHOB|nr:PhzF family phenazine biosynthesis protein [Sulfitobacter algicola]